ncbi:MAG: family 10 glycosylhydrolase [Bacilli bacterium]|nr:family 10 glycosylhydrolase [Bacilli bacterium]
MKNKIFIILLLTTFVFMVSCKKQAPQETHHHIFNEFYECINCDYINEGYDFTDKTCLKISQDSYTFKIEDIEKNKVRRTSTIVAYNYKQPIEVDSNGYEVAVSKYGLVVEVGIHVDMPTEGTVFSATGSYRNQLQNIAVGNIAIYDSNTLYVYQNDDINQYHHVISMFYDTFLNIRKKGLLENYQNELLALLPKMETFYLEYDEEIELDILNILKSMNVLGETIIDLYNHQHQYSYIENKIQLFNFDYSSKNAYSMDDFYLFSMSNGSDIKIIDQEYVVANDSIYVSIDEFGIVREKGTNVHLIPSGYIIEGTNDARNFINDHISINDKIGIESMLDDRIVNVYQDIDLPLKNNLINLRNNIVNEVNTEIEHQIPHDYTFIASIVNRIDSIINYHEYGSSNATDGLYNYVAYYYDLDMIHDYINLIYSQLIDNNIDQHRGIWYYPFLKFNNIYLYDDTSLEGVQHTLQTMKDMGINNVFLLLFTDLSTGYLLYDSLYYDKIPELNSLEYGEYGHDYVKCFISEAHKLGMAVTAYTQTFYAHMDAMKNKIEAYHSLDYYGNVASDGNFNVQHYDVCNDNLQDFLIEYYIELVNKYDFDGIEYDFIRYAQSNLNQYNNVEVIPESSTIKDDGYTDYTMNKFMNLYHLEGDLKVLIRNSKSIRTTWLNFKSEELNNFVGRLSAAIRSVKPNILISAAVFPDNSSGIRLYRQDYLKWIQEGYINAIEPMNYTDDVNRFVNVLNYLNNLHLDADIRSGIAAKIISENLLTDLKEIRLMDQYGNYTLFSAHYYYRDNTFVKLMSINHHYSYLSSRSTEEEILHAKCIDTIDMITNYFSQSSDLDYSDLLSALSSESITNILFEISGINNANMKEYLLDRFG